MTLNEIMLRYNFITKVILRDKDKELSKDLKVRIMAMRIELGKIRKNLEEDMQEAVKGFTPDGYKELVQKEDKSENEKAQIEKWNTQINDEYNAYVDKRGKEEIQVTTKLTNEDFNELVDVNAGNDIEINGAKIQAPDFLEVLYSLFVE